MTTKQAAEYAGVSVSTLRNWMKEGLQYSRVGSRCTRIHPDDVDAYLRRYKSGIDIDAQVEEILGRIRRGKVSRAKRR